jgi:hypothetical protein
MVRLACIIAIAGILSGCSRDFWLSPKGEDLLFPGERQQRLEAEARALAAQEDAQCRSYGAKPGSQEYVQCRMSLKQQDEARRLAVIRAVARNPPMAAAPQVPPPPPAPNRSINCTSIANGNITNINCQ